MGDVIDTQAIKIPLEQVVALEREVRVRKSQLRDHQLHRLWHLRGLAHAELAKHLLHLRIIRIGDPQLKRAGFLDQHEVPDAYRRFTRVI